MKDVIALSELVEKIDFQQKLALEARHVLERDYTDRELYERCEADAKELVTSQGWLSEEEAAERTRDYALYYKKEFTTNFIKGYVEGCIRCYVILATKKKLSLEEALEYIKADEYVEVTPKSMRIRKIILDHLERKRANRED